MAQKKTNIKVRNTDPPIKLPSKKYVSKEIPCDSLKKSFRRADLIFDGVEHGGPSFEARVFLNNEKADAKTPKDLNQGYAGSFHVFGHGGCFGDVGHCDVRGTPRQYDPRPAHPLTPARKVLIATDALRRVADKSKAMKVTIVPIVRSESLEGKYDDVLKFDKISVVTYN